MGYLFSSFLWTYLLCLMPMGILVDKFGSKIVNARASQYGRLRPCSRAWRRVTLR